MKFIDHTEISVFAGCGGNGMVSFRTARNKPKLGPDGGNGGNGGDVLLIPDLQANTLSRFRYREMFRAEDGGKGGTNNKTGRCGETLKISVPLGTAVFGEKDELLGEILTPEDSLLVAKGGTRGYGNLHYVLATRQAPVFSTEGKKGEIRVLKLELKLLADVGLVGMPNAGKSTLLSVLSAARPKIADYPFTTLTPQLGVVDVDDAGHSFVMADIPGLIEGAAKGKGLGLDFLRHVERTKVLAFLIDAFPMELEGEQGFSPWQIFEKLRQELHMYSEQLLEKKFVVVLTKTDLSPSQKALEDVQKPFHENGLDICPISSITGDQLKELKWWLHGLMTKSS